jgi:hypothetical protein
MAIRNKNTNKDVMRIFMADNFDFVFEKFLDEISMDKDTENIKYNEPHTFFKDGISTIVTLYVIRKIKKKQEINNDFNLPKIRPNMEKAYLLEDISLVHYIKDGLILANGNTPGKIAKILENKNIKILLNPISQDKLIFDEQCARVAGEQKKIIAFDMNEFRRHPYKAINQAKFIIKLLKKHRVDMMFCSFAGSLDELVGNLVRSSFAEELGLEKSTVNRFMDEGILCQRKK